MPKSKGRGRRKGSRNKGYFYRQGRGWYVKDQGNFVPLVSASGARLKDADLPSDVVKTAYHAWLLAKAAPSNNTSHEEPPAWPPH